MRTQRAEAEINSMLELNGTVTLSKVADKNTTIEELMKMEKVKALPDE